MEIVTLNLGIRCFLSVADVNHNESFGSLIESHNEILETSLGRMIAATVEHFKQASLVEKYVHRKLKFILIEGANIIFYRFRQFARSPMAAILTERDQFRDKYDSISV